MSEGEKRRISLAMIGRAVVSPAWANSSSKVRAQLAIAIIA